ncbi:MAG: DUF1592 domain-containing protein [Sandaracinaceae bacterium]
MSRTLSTIALSSAFLLAACEATVTLPAEPAGPLDEIACRGPAEAAPAPLHRVAIEEYVAGLRALVGDAPVDGIGDVLATLPPDDSPAEEAFEREDHRVSGALVEGTYQVADGLANAIANDETARVTLVGECGAAVDEACLRAFLPDFLRQAYRRPATSEEIDGLVEAAGEFEGAQQLEAVLFLTLMSPDFLYRFETRGEVRDGAIELTPFELASRLSYHFWGTPPDAELLAAAENGELASEDGYRAQVERIYEDSRTDDTIRAFFGQWLHLERGAFAPGPRLDMLRDGTDVDGLDAEMIQELYALIEYHLNNDGSWSDILTSNLSFAQSDRLAAIYGVPAWDGEGAPPPLPEGERSGLLTRAGLLYTTDGSTNPFRRGIFLRRVVLCDEVPPPPANIPADALQPPPVESAQTTRTAFENKVLEQPCAGCHVRFSPLGYAMEAYDGLGRFRTEEWLVTDLGEDRGTVAVDTRVVGEIEPGDRSVQAGPVALSSAIAESGRADQCLARRYFQYMHRRTPEGVDECTVGALLGRLEAGEPLRNALRDVALEPAFRERLLED